MIHSTSYYSAAARDCFMQCLVNLAWALAIMAVTGFLSMPLHAKLITGSSQPDLETRLDRLMRRIQTGLNILPGISVSVVQGDEVLLMKGYGVADVETGVAFTPDTYSYIASGTKAFVGLTVAVLVQRGELDLDRPVGPTYLSDIPPQKLGRFGQVTLRQLLTHTHGLDGGAIEFRTALTGDINSTLVWDLLGKVEVSEQGSGFDYGNFGYVAAAYVLEHIYGENWQTLVERTVFAPAGMSSTVFTVSELLGREYAKPHQWMGSTQQIPMYKRDSTMHAAGGNFTTGRDLARWLTLNISAGHIGGQQVLPSEAFSLSHAPLAGLADEFYVFKRTAYGLGWYVSDYENAKLLHHFGAFSGYRSHVSIMPGLGMGVAVLSNDNSPATIYLPDMIASFVYDLVLGKPDAEEKFEQQIIALEERMAPHAGRSMPERPRNAPENEMEFAGLYKNETWGVWQLREDNGELRLHWGNADAALIYVEREGRTYIRFEVAGNGYLALPVRAEDGRLEGLTFKGAFFEKIR